MSFDMEGMETPNLSARPAPVAPAPVVTMTVSALSCWIVRSVVMSGSRTRGIDRTVMAMEAKYSPDTIATMEENLDILRSDWKAFIGRWLPVIKPGEWEKFGVQAESMLDRLSSQVMLETEILYDYALRDGVVRPGGAVLH